MDKNQILQSEWLDILFDGKNKSYGAYELRKTYNSRLKKAIIVSFSIAALFVTVILMANENKTAPVSVTVVDISLEKFKDENKKVEIVKPIKKEPVKIKTVSVTPPKIVKDNEVKPEEEVKPIDQMENVQINNFNQEGEKNNELVNPPVEKSIAGVSTIAKEEDIDKIFYAVQIPAEFPGGLNGWRKYLERNLNSDLPIENGAPAGKYTVVVSFLVDKNGAISDVVAENDPGYGTKAEAIRVITKGPNWKPAIQNGNKVIYRHKQSITFLVSEE
ncbi:energy transducer TonB [Sediminibacterium sp.]|uniref:energy transducer TonB n=1 Tax=Sediminibacterium sp. TaxID=1917865 RepID=UPI002733A7FF|nr:energy transducer TonB [Sediminibacterium sp.]MDP3392253.1 energy transducer TonB [Sediminibacterium sp.]MDP3566945.1 energy transducer TonB [Sediminibacterium sp.]